MVIRRLVNFRLEEDLLAALDAVKEQRGYSYTVQVRLALRDWFARQGITEKAGRRRASTPTPTLTRQRAGTRRRADRS